jgi:hypothetical protein
LFGGLSGIVAISSKQKGNVIPGVAIATALMPPLCTAGYGLATRQFDYFFGAIYLFTINTIFIAFAAVLVSQILKFPIHGEINDQKKLKINRIISIVIIIVMLPSIYFGYRLIEEEKFIHNAQKYISNVNLFEGNYLLKSDINSKKKSINLVYGGSKLDSVQIKKIIMKTKDFDLADSKIFIEQGLSFGDLDNKNFELIKLKEKLINFQNLITKKQKIIDSLNNIPNIGKTLYGELKNFYPQITNFNYSTGKLYNDTSDNGILYHTFILSSKSTLSKNDKAKIINWLKVRLSVNNINIFFN